MTEDTIPCISLHQPWAQWVILGWKPIESRTHERFKKLVGKRIGIHAARHWDKDWLESARKYLTASQIEQTRGWRDDPKYAGSNLLGTVFVLEHRQLRSIDSRLALIDCSDGDRFGLVLEEPHPLNMPIMMKGMRQIFYVPAIQ